LSGLTPLVPGVSGDARRAESVAGFANINADYAESTAVAADQKALEAAIAADAAMTEAQFGSIAVGRLLAGTITAALSIESPVITGGTISGGTISIAGTGGTTMIGTAGISTGFLETPKVDVATIDLGLSGSIYRDYIGAFGDVIRVAGTMVGSGGARYVTEGSRTSGLAAWEGTSTSGPNFTSFDSSHNHAVPQHRHTVTV